MELEEPVERPTYGRGERILCIVLAVGFASLAVAVAAVDLRWGGLSWGIAGIAAFLLSKSAQFLLYFIRTKSAARSNMVLLPADWLGLAAGCTLAAVLVVVQAVLDRAVSAWFLAAAFLGFGIMYFAVSRRTRCFAA